MRLGHRLRLDLRSGSEWSAYYSRVFDDRRIAAVCRLLDTPGGLAVDAGAHIGFWAVPLAAHLARLGGRLLAVEPLPANARRLRENLRLNALQHVAEVAEVALSDRRGTARLGLREDFRDGAGTGNAAVVVPDGGDEVFPQVDVPSVRLDDLLAGAESRVDLVKADLEGHEDRFLAGAVGTFRRWRPVAVIEWNRVYYARRGLDPAAALSAPLAGLDYRCLRCTGTGWVSTPDVTSPRPLDDLVLAPRERAADVAATISAPLTGPW